MQATLTKPSEREALAKSFAKGHASLLFEAAIGGRRLSKIAAETALQAVVNFIENGSTVYSEAGADVVEKLTGIRPLKPTK